jgi:hypothetical protein
MDWVAVAAVGGWVAAFVTFFAVLLPYLAGKRKAEIAQRLAGLDFEIFFSDLEYRVRFAASLMELRASKQTWFTKVDWETLRIPPVLHGFEPREDTLKLLVQLRLLQKEISEWNGFVEIHTNIGELSDEHRDGATAGLIRTFKGVQNRTSNVREAFKSVI